MTASLFESNDSASQFLRDTLNSRNSVMSIELGPLQSLDGLLGDDLKSSPRSSTTMENDNNHADNEYTIDLKAPNSNNGSSPRVVEAPLQPTKVTRSASEAERFVNKMKAILQVKLPDQSNSNRSNAPVVAASLPPMPSPMAAASRKRSLSEMTVDSMIWNNLGSGSGVEQVNYADIFRTQESVKPVVLAQPKTQPAHKVAVVVTTAAEQRVYVIPTENDVLCGKGGRTNNNPANKRYLRLKDAMQARYLVAEKAEKKEISQELVDIVNQQWKGRFLKKETTGREERWYELDNEAARKKCSQALREINTPEKRAEKRARYAK